MPWTPLCNLADLRDAAGYYVEAAGLKLAVFLHEGKPHVLDDECPHAGASLASGSIENGCAICPRHQWAFRLHDGQLRDSPFVKVNAYPARIVDGRVEADLPAAEP